MMMKFFNIVSAVFSPLMVPTYGMIIALQMTGLAVVPWRAKFAAVAVVFVLTGLLPFLLIHGLKTLGLVKNFGLSERTDRSIPYAATFCFYVATVVYLFMVSAPMWLIGFMAGGVFGLAVVSVVNRRWKISAHAAGMGGLLAMLVVMAIRTGMISLLPVLIAAVVSTGLVATARIALRCHTPMQVAVGCAVGFMCVFSLSWF